MIIGISGCKSTKNENNEDLGTFSEYIDELVKTELEGDFLTYHFMLVDGDLFDVDKPEVTLGSLTLESTLESVETCKEELEVLYQFDVDELSDEEQDIYRLLELQYKENIEYENHLNFDYCFGDNKVNDNLITNFTEYRFSNVDDVKDYITLLNDTGRYIDEGIERTKELAKEGYVQNELIQDSVIESCSKFMNSTEIEKYFDSEIIKLDISDNDIENYKKQVEDGVNIMQEAYGRIVDLYKELPTSDYQGSLSEIKGGKDYFEYLIKAYTGSDRSVKEWMKLLEEEIDDTIMEWVMIIWYGEHDVYEEMENIELPFDNAQEVVEYLEKCMSSEFPIIDKVEYSVKYLDASVANDLTSAYYVIPPLDAPEMNTIKVNPKNTDLLELFSTLAHEGFPGHLYQNNYSIQNKLPTIYYFLDNLGASEGWAEYVGHDAYRLGNIGSDDFQEFMRLMNYLDRILVEYIDMRVNYSGWDVEDIKDYLDDIGLVNDMAEGLYEAVIQYPALYAPYSLGTYEVYRLKELVQDELGNDFDLVEFHKTLLDTNLVHFEIIEKKINEYIKSK